MRLVVYDLSNLVEKIIPIFDNNLISQKKYDFIKFKNVQKLMVEKKHLTEKGRELIIEEKYK